MLLFRILSLCLCSPLLSIKIDPDCMSRADPNKEWTIDSYLGDNQGVLLVLLIIGIADHYPVRESLP